MAQAYPRAFGKYLLLRPLARGGMGEIFLAAAGEIGGFEKLCVIKKVLSEHADDSKAARFLDEAKVVLRLSHGNLVGVFDAGVADGEFYIAMEFVEGRDLGAVWNRCAERRARFPVDIALYVVREICRGLAYAHTYGGLSLVHRDVTPPNLLLSYFGEVKLTDFGLARSVLKQEFTAPGVVYGRLAYLSPEQAHGRTVDARSDLYSLGIILWELLTGTQLFRVSAADPVTAISVVRNPKIEPPSKRVPRLPHSLDELVMRALAPLPEDRFQSAGEMLRAVSVALATLAPTIDAERIAAFMRMLYGEEIERERAERDQLLGRDRTVARTMPEEPPAESAAAPAPPRPAGEVQLVRVPTPGDATMVERRVRRGAGRAASPVGIESVAAAMDAALERGGDPPTVVERAPVELPEGGNEVPAPNRAGEVIDQRYRLHGLLGAGGMGTVYEAEHVDIGKRVAIKILHPLYSDNADLVKRFRREARAASTIGHPHIVDVTDFGTTADGCAYFVMERLDGHDLKQLLQLERQLPLGRAVGIAIQVCRAVHAAHEQGIIHRDLKPENVFLVAREGNPDFVKILDFGIAKNCGPVGHDSRSLTLPGIAMGTPVYMAPEQAAGQRVDARTDIYAVGALLYEMIGGAPPFTGEDALDVLTRKATVAAEPLSTRRADVPPALEAVILRALAIDPARRQQSLTELEQELLQALPAQSGVPGQLLGLMVSAPESGRARRTATPGPAGGTAPEPLALAGTEPVPAAGMSIGMAPALAPVSGPSARRSRWLPVAAFVGLVAAGVAGYVGLSRLRAGSGATVAPPGKAAGARAANEAKVSARPTADVPPASAPASQPTAARTPRRSTVTPAELTALLEAARKAAAAKRYVSPPGDCMRDFLARIEEADPKNVQAAALRTTVVQALHEEAAAALRKRRYDRAEAAYRSLHRLDERDARATLGLTRTLLRRADASLQRRRFVAAAADAREALLLDEKSPAAHLLYGEAMLRTGKYQSAVEQYRRALELKPRSREAKRGLQQAERLAARVERAARESEKAKAQRAAKHKAKGKAHPRPKSTAHGGKRRR